MNHIHLIGRLGGDPSITPYRDEKQPTDPAKPRRAHVQFDLAVHRRHANPKTGEIETDWLPVTLFDGAAARFAATYLKKGARVAVSGGASRPARTKLRPVKGGRPSGSSATRSSASTGAKTDQTGKLAIVRPARRTSSTWEPGRRSNERTVLLRRLGLSPGVRRQSWGWMRPMRRLRLRIERA